MAVASSASGPQAFADVAHMSTPQQQPQQPQQLRQPQFMVAQPGTTMAYPGPPGQPGPQQAQLQQHLAQQHQQAAQQHQQFAAQQMAAQQQRAGRQQLVVGGVQQPSGIQVAGMPPQQNPQQNSQQMLAMQQARGPAMLAPVQRSNTLPPNMMTAQFRPVSVPNQPPVQQQPQQGPMSTPQLGHAQPRPMSMSGIPPHLSPAQQPQNPGQQQPGSQQQSIFMQHQQQPQRIVSAQHQITLQHQPSPMLNGFQHQQQPQPQPQMGAHPHAQMATPTPFTQHMQTSSNMGPPLTPHQQLHPGAPPPQLASSARPPQDPAQQHNTPFLLHQTIQPQTVPSGAQQGQPNQTSPVRPPTSLSYPVQNAPTPSASDPSQMPQRAPSVHGMHQPMPPNAMGQPPQPSSVFHQTPAQVLSQPPPPDGPAPSDALPPPLGSSTQQQGPGGGPEQHHSGQQHQGLGPNQMLQQQQQLQQQQPPQPGSSAPQPGGAPMFMTSAPGPDGQPRMIARPGPGGPHNPSNPMGAQMVNGQMQPGPGMPQNANMGMQPGQARLIQINGGSVYVGNQPGQPGQPATPGGAQVMGPGGVQQGTSQNAMQPQNGIMGPARQMSHPMMGDLQGMEGLGILRLWNFSTALAQESPERNRPDYWERQMSDSFMPMGQFKLGLCRSDLPVPEVKTFELTPQLFARFCAVNAQSDVLSMNFVFDGAKERVGHGRGSNSMPVYLVECPNASLIFRFSSGYIVTLRGPVVSQMSLVRTQNHPQGVCKFDMVHFEAKTHEKYLASSRLPFKLPQAENSAPTNASLHAASGLKTEGDDGFIQRSPDAHVQVDNSVPVPVDPVNSFGIPQGAMRCLELMENINAMEPLIYYAEQGDPYSPMETLKTVARDVRSGKVVGMYPIAVGPGSVPMQMMIQPGQMPQHGQMHQPGQMHQLGQMHQPGQMYQLSHQQPQLQQQHHPQQMQHPYGAGVPAGTWSAPTPGQGPMPSTPHQQPMVAPGVVGPGHSPSGPSNAGLGPQARATMVTSPPRPPPPTTAAIQPSPAATGGAGAGWSPQATTPSAPSPVATTGGSKRKSAAQDSDGAGPPTKRQATRRKSRAGG